MANSGKSGSKNPINTISLVESRELPLDVLNSTDKTKPLSANKGRYLNESLDSEGLTRALADSTLQSSISSEASIRSAADSNLQSNINAEASARSEADSTLSTIIASIPVSIFGEVPTITVGEAAISLVHTPIAKSVRVYFNNDICFDYTLTENVITFPEILYEDDIVLVDYSYSRI